MSEKISFEQALAQLEECVARLETGEIRLEEALHTFEQGVKASRVCAEWLEHTRKRVKVLTAAEDGELLISAFGQEEDEDLALPGDAAADRS